MTQQAIALIWAAEKFLDVLLHSLNDVFLFDFDKTLRPEGVELDAV